MRPLKPWLKIPGTKPGRLIAGAGAGLFIVIIMLYGWYRLELRAVSKVTTQQAFEVESGQSASVVATNLASAHLIRSRTAFLTYLNFHGLRGRVKAGGYAIAPSLSGIYIAGLITSGNALSDRLTVPEGYRISQIETAAAARGISKTDFEAALAGPHSQTFLSSKPAGVSLEGYLFPDSYELGSSTTATQLVDTMLDTFGKRVGTEYTQAFAAEGLTLHQGLTLASIVEREVNNADDRPIVAQIFLKRYKEGQPLGSDVTVHYASDLAGVSFNLDINSPYNTRKFTGLPPGPICNPGLSSLDAVAHPATTDYNFFLTGTDGKTYYAKTYAQHQQNIQKYLK